MLRSIKELHGYRLGAVDGEIGHVKGFLFDDQDWVIRYFVADTGSWMPERRVLISPYAVTGVYAGGKLLEVNLTRAKVEDSPSIDTELPIARQQEADYHRYYRWPAYWGGTGIWGSGALPVAPPEFEPESEPYPPAQTTTRLRRAQEIIGYSVQAQDGEVGHVEDFLLDDTSWSIRELVVATSQWWSGRNVQVPPQTIERVNWDDSNILIHLTRSAIQEEPAYEYAGPAQADHDPRLFR